MNKLVDGILIELTQEEEAAWLISQIVTLEDTKQRKLSELAALRFQKETAGITLNGSVIRTDRESQGMVTGAYCTSLLNPAVLINFKGANGWIQIDATEIAGISSAVSSYVQSCFTNEKVLTLLIEAATTVSDVQAIDLTTGWT